MVVFFTIAIIAFLYILITSIAGHAHDLGHDIVSGELGHDTDHGESGHITSIFSTRVIATFLMGFGATGGIAKFYNIGYPLSSLFGFVVGGIVAALMFWLLEFFAKQQANSLITTSTLVGKFGTVEVPIQGTQPGEVSVVYGERYGTYIATSRDGKSIAKGRSVRIVATVGSNLTVEEVS